MDSDTTIVQARVFAGNNIHQDNILTFAPLSKQAGTNMYNYDLSSIVKSGVLASTPFGKMSVLYLWIYEPVKQFQLTLIK